MLKNYVEVLKFMISRSKAMNVIVDPSTNEVNSIRPSQVSPKETFKTFNFT